MLFRSPCTQDHKTNANDRYKTNAMDSRSQDQRQGQIPQNQRQALKTTRPTPRTDTTKPTPWTQDHKTNAKDRYHKTNAMDSRSQETNAKDRYHKTNAMHSRSQDQRQGQIPQNQRHALKITKTTWNVNICRSKMTIITNFVYLTAKQT